MLLGGSSEYSISRSKQAIQLNRAFIALFTIIRTDRNMLLACYSHKHISYRIRTIIRKAITHDIYRTINNLVMQKKLIISSIGVTIHKVAPPVPSVHGGVFFTYRNALQE